MTPIDERQPMTMNSNAPQRTSTESLISDLGAQLQPVRPLASPVLRALGWLAFVALAAGLFIARHHALPRFIARNANPATALECAAMLLTGIVAVVAAFHASIPGRSAAWRWAPVPPLLLWLAGSGLGCLHNGLGLGASGARFGESPGCFMFIVVTSLPLALVLGWLLRRARPLEPLPVALLGALGVAALAGFVLQFFHPFDTTVIDLLFHAAAVCTMLVIASGVRRVLA
ncbi:MAG: hypothetical protein RL684_2038 [Pseudomonadota bacterium]